MKRLLFMITVSFLFGEKNIYGLYKIPSFKYNSLAISGDDLLNIKSQGESNSYSLNLSGSYSSFYQSPISTLSYSFTPELKINKEINDSTALAAILFNSLFTGSRYFSHDYLGSHFFYNGNFALSLKDEETTNPLELLIGFGYGRVTSARPVAQAIVISNELGRNLSNKQLIQTADIIGKAGVGYYVNKFKDDANIHYYNDLARAINASDKIMKIQQILSNPAYANLAVRYTGWQIRFGYQNTFLVDADSFGKVLMKAEYAKPLGLDKQFYSGLEYNLQGFGIDEGLESTAKIFTSYAIDHTYTWTSKLDATVDIVIPDGGELYSILDLKLSSTRVIINTLTATGELNFIKAGENNDPFFEVNIRLTYFVF